MAREVNRLTARTVQSLREPGRYADGNGLYLVIGPGESRRWVVFLPAAGKRLERGLGSARDVTLAQARVLAKAAREKAAAGEPVGKRAAQAPPKPITFGDVAERYMEARAELWRSAVHRRQWRQTLETQAAAIWRLPVADVATGHVLDVLRPMWATKAETARRLRGRLERILDAAKAEGLRTGENPARWAGHLALILPPAKKLTRGHHAALAWADLPDFVADLRRREATSARALELLILTAARSGEVRGMRWAEVDFDAAVWTVPAERMKAKRLHRVPLVPRALELLEEMRPLSEDSELVFPNLRGNVSSDMVFSALLDRMGRTGITTHGFRSTFRDWAGDETEYPREIVEAALAHLVGDEVERAYRRSDALDKRRRLMEAWAAFCASSCDERAAVAADVFA